MDRIDKSLDGKALREQEELLKELGVGELREKFVSVMGYPSRSRNRCFLIRKILWGLQAREVGDICPEAREKALGIADEREVRVNLSGVARSDEKSLARKKTYRFSPVKDSRLPLPGSVLVREYRGRQVRVTVGTEDFEFEGRRYKSLSAIAKEVTGSSYNGFLFFKIT